ncbi:MAG: metallophosphoesterase, partial [Clostridiaceae bacterium]|nr:metallophosphoesterase [Clostridiaceae bacterium]
MENQIQGKNLRLSEQALLSTLRADNTKEKKNRAGSREIRAGRGGRLRRRLAGLLALVTAVVSLGFGWLGASTVATVNAAESAGQDNKLTINVISDVHIYPPHFVSNSQAYLDYVSGDPKMLKESSYILEEALKEVKAQNPQFLIIPGDLTKDGEREGHE